MVGNASFFERRLPLFQQESRQASMSSNVPAERRVSWKDNLSVPAELLLDSSQEAEAWRTVSTPRRPRSTQSALRSSSKQEGATESRKSSKSSIADAHEDAAEAAAWLFHHGSRSKPEGEAEFRSASAQSNRTSTLESINTFSRSSSCWDEAGGGPPGRRSRADSLVSWTSPCWEEARWMFQERQDELVQTARALPKREVAQVAQWDILTLRQWFNIMDVDHDGTVSRHECFGFLVKHPKFRDILQGDYSQPVKDRFSPAGSQHLRNQAVQMKQVMKILKDVFGKSGTCDFEEFAEFFRRSGRLVEYQSNENPIVKMADLLGDFHNGDKAVVSKPEARQMVQLARQNLPGARLKAMERNISKARPSSSRRSSKATGVRG